MIVIAVFFWLFHKQLMPSGFQPSQTIHVAKTKAQRQRAALKVWLENPENQANAQAYSDYLSAQVTRQLNSHQYAQQAQQAKKEAESRVYVPPLHELLHNSHAVKHASCNLPAFTVPPRRSWQKLVPTLVLINKLKDESILPDIGVTSGYRDKKTNTCVGGSQRSKHMDNAALDFTLKDLSKGAQQHVTRQLCEFWQHQSKKYRMGLGTYGAGRYHIDTQGYRIWGKDFTRETSLCLSVN